MTSQIRPFVFYARALFRTVFGDVDPRIGSECTQGTWYSCEAIRADSMISVTVYKDGPVLIQNGNTLLRAHNVTDALTRWPGSSEEFLKNLLAYRQEVAMLLNEATEAYGQVPNTTTGQPCYDPTISTSSSASPSSSAPSGDDARGTLAAGSLSTSTRAKASVCALPSPRRLTA